MDWSPERVINFGPVTHRRNLRWKYRTNLLLPVYAWRVVTPVPHERPLNMLQRAVLRFQIAGIRDSGAIAEMLGIASELVDVVDEQLQTMNVIDNAGSLTNRGRQLLDGSELDLSDMRVGWVFQDSWTGRLLPRFATSLNYADVDSDEDGRAWVHGGTKGAPRRDWAFVLKPGQALVSQPQPIDILDAARRHRRHERRAKRSGIDLDVLTPEAIQQVSMVSETPEVFHLLSFLYVPENIEDEDEPWYVADPFGFGASSQLRDQFEKLLDESQGGLRDVIGKMTGEHDARRRDAWMSMQEIMRDEARRLVTQNWPRGAFLGEDKIRESLVIAFEEVVRLEQQTQSSDKAQLSFDGAYLKLRQALEGALQIVREKYPPHDAWRKIYEGEQRWLPKDSVRTVLKACACACGFNDILPDGFQSPNAGKIKAMCFGGSASNLRPLCMALILSATQSPNHPFRRLGSTSPMWLTEFDRVAAVAGSEIHRESRSQNNSSRTVVDLRKDADAVTDLCKSLCAALAD